MSEFAADDGPQIVRPIPRRPFNFNFTGATPPEEDSSPGTPASPDRQDPRFLLATPEPESLTRPQSFQDLTSSTLYGIYSPTTNNVFSNQDELDTPWGTGAQTPIKRPSIDDATFDFLRDRSHGIRRRSSIRTGDAPNLTSSPPLPSLALLISRGLLLFCLGVGYGAMVTTTSFHSQSGKLSSLGEGIGRPRYNWAHLATWGVAGVILGALLPWFDGVWEESVGEGRDDVEVVKTDGAPTKDPDPRSDWPLVIRAVGAFVGILFAIVSF